MITPVDYSRFALRLSGPLPMLTGISQIGDDRIAVRIGHPEAIALVRVLPPNYAGWKEALELGLVELLNPERSIAKVLAALAAAEHGAVDPQAAGPRRLALVP